MSAISSSATICREYPASIVSPSSFSAPSAFSSPIRFSKLRSRHAPLSSSLFSPRGRNSSVCSSKSPEGEAEAEVSGVEEDEWLQKLPDKRKPLYSHSLPCLEAWLKSLGFHQSKEDRAVWFVENPDWHAHLALDVTDLYIRYLKSGPGNLEKDVERRFSYALSREDIYNAILGGP